MFRFQVNNLRHHDYVWIQIAIHDCVTKKGGVFVTLDVSALSLLETATAATAATAPAAPATKATEERTATEEAVVEAEEAVVEAEEVAMHAEEGHGLCFV